MYVIRSTPGQTLPSGAWLPGSRTLCEMSAREFAAATSETPPEWAQGFTFRRVSPDYARQYVDRGGHHETALYRGEDRQGRVRILYARG